MVKRVAFMRHGEAAHNVLISAGQAAAGRALRDPPLTALGRAQAAEVASSARAATFDVVVVSPMRRALETATVAFGPSIAAGAAVVVTSLHTESGVPVPGQPAAGQPCQQGSRPDSLRATFDPEDRFDWSAVDEATWNDAPGAHDWSTVEGRGADLGFFHPDLAEGRVDAFRTFLRDLHCRRPKAETASLSVVVVGHSAFFLKFLGDETKMKNCELCDKDI